MPVRTPNPGAAAWGVAFCLWVAALVAAAPPCSAQILAQVVPVRDAITARPGTPVLREIIVTNRSDAPAVVRVRLSDWTVGEEGEFRLLPLGSLPATLAGCVRFEPDVFTLAAGQSGRVQVALELPADGPPTRWGVLLSEIRPATAPRRELGPQAIAELGTTLYLSSVAPDRVAPEIVALQAAAAGRDSLAFTVRVRNAGERQLHFAGELTLADSTGHAVRSGRLPSGVVLPGRERVLTWMCDASLPPGLHRVTATLDTGQAELLVGETRLSLPVQPPAMIASRP